MLADREILPSALLPECLMRYKESVLISKVRLACVSVAVERSHMQLGQRPLIFSVVILNP